MKLKIVPKHKQAELEEIAIRCDARIAQIIRGLNNLGGVWTTNSCWNVNNKGAGYVKVMTHNGGFIEYLKSTVDSGVYQVDDSMKNGGALVAIRPKYEEGQERWQRDIMLDQKWIDLLEISLQYDNTDS